MPAATQRRNVSTLRRQHITITNRQRIRTVDSYFLRRIIQTLLHELQIGHADLAIHLVTTAEITRLNETFLHHAGSTDVIAFDYSENALPCVQPANLLHGEIFVCVEEALAQARRFHTTWQTELVRYAIHGTLHLLGFDDSNPAARRKMKRAEDRWLRILSLRFLLTRLARGRVAR